jgi:hypothetical protein
MVGLVGALCCQRTPCKYAQPTRPQDQQPGSLSALVSCPHFGCANHLTTGIYLAKLTNRRVFKNYIIFAVRVMIGCGFSLSAASDNLQWQFPG